MLFIVEKAFPRRPMSFKLPVVDDALEDLEVVQGFFQPLGHEALALSNRAWPRCY
jgi:hypothetical protein